jgi:hypothetical protein
MDVRFRLTALCATVLFVVAACSASKLNVPVANAPAARSIRPNWWGCNPDSNARPDWWGCSTILVEPLAFDGTKFAPVKADCGHVRLDDAPVYKASASGTLAVGTTTLSTVCVPHWHDSSDKGHHWGWWHGNHSHALYIVAYDAGSNDDSDRTIVAGPADFRASPWVFAPSSPGLTTRAGSAYVFFVAWTGGPPSPTPSPITTPPPATFGLVAPLRWENGTFSNVPVADCSNVTTSSAPSYVASSSGAFSVSGSVTLAPNCAPGSYEALYLIAVQVTSGGGACSGSKAVLHKRSTVPNSSAVVNGWVIAGPAGSGASPWVFDTSGNEFVTQACVTYAFFIGTIAGSK